MRNRTHRQSDYRLSFLMARKEGAMKVKVIRRYVDRHTKEIKEVGTIEEYAKSRAEELKRAGYVKDITESQKNDL